MLKKRLIFTLLVADGRFMLSRNFSLQGVGTLDWIHEYYEFESIANSIDELVVLDVSRGERNARQFADLLRELGRRCFMPIAAGGGVRSVDDAKRLLRAGADKVVVNSPLFDDGALVGQLARHFGNQCIVASIDYKREGDSSQAFRRNGAEPTGLSLPQAMQQAQTLGAGELYLTSIAKDGTGQGFDEEFIDQVARTADVPVIASGGAGNFGHLASALQRDSISGASTANLFNFMADGLTEARRHVLEAGVALARWPSMESLHAH
jgi:imidazole glycerol-phosphate synthase subunit HisF